MKEEVASLQEENRRLKEESKMSKGEIASLQEENRRLKEESKMSKEENRRLKEESKMSKKEIATFKKETASLKEENKEMKEKIETYKMFLLSIKEKSSDLKFFDIDEYEEESVIGEGATSKVKIVHKKEKYAKKELLLFDHKLMQKFLKECEILFNLRHPCIIRVYGFNIGDETHKPSIILSLEPKSLDSAIKNKELDEEQKNRIIVELVLGMRYIHKFKIMHRDLKPLNILLSKNNHVRIADFGLATEEDFEITQTKGVGTLLFMAPELFDNENEKGYTNKVDVYSFGVILIFIVTDKYPSKSIITGVFPKLSEEIPRWVRELITNCLSRNPENRPSFAEIFEIIKANNFDFFSDSKDNN